MQRYILKRVAMALFCIFGISVIVFLLSYLSGDPAVLLAPPNATKEDLQQIRVQRGLDKPVYEQYWKFVSGAVRGDFGESLRWKMPVMKMFLDRFPNTLQLALAAMALALCLGIPTGIFSAVHNGSWFDRFGKVFAFCGQAAPSFWLGTMLILLFAVTFKILPTSGMGDWRNLIMPAFALGWYLTAALTRMSRSAMLDVLDSEYIKMARLKGVPEILVIVKHALRNAAIPVVTMSAMQFVGLLGGTAIIEMIFNWPGVGRLIVDAIFARDFPVVQTTVLITSSMVVFANLLVDILYGYIDPRIRY